MKKRSISPTKDLELRNPQVSPDHYCSNEKYQDHLFEQYKLYIEMADRLSERRILANTFFLTLHTLIIGITGYSYNNLLLLEHKWILVLPLVAVLSLCYAWRRMLISYKQLNTAKFAVIGEYENLLPTHPFVETEWKALGYGKDPKLYKPLTDVESWIPFVFAALYIIGVVIISISDPSLLNTQGVPSLP